MAEKRTMEELIERLSGDLSVVRRTPPLRSSLLAVLGSWFVIFLLAGLLHDPWLESAVARVDDPARWSVLLALAMSGVGGVISGLASSVPGRERIERVGFRIVLVGLGLFVGSLVAMAPGTRSDATPLASDFGCFVSGASMAIVPALTLIGALRLGWVQRPGRAAGLALLGAFALGGLIVHCLCAYEGSRHALLGHASIPIAACLVGVLPLTSLLKRFAR